MIAPTIAIIIAASLPVSASGLRHNESYYAHQWCDAAGGQSEVVTESGARVDCLTAEYAVEVDWSGKWAEAIGQSLHYGVQTGRRAAILLLMREDYQPAHLYRLQDTIDRNGLDIELFIQDVVE